MLPKPSPLAKKKMEELRNRKKTKQKHIQSQERIDYLRAYMEQFFPRKHK